MYKKKDIEYIINSFIEIIKTNIKNGLSVKIDGLGTFSTFTKKVYIKKTLDTGHTDVIPNVKCVSFKPSKKLKE